MGVLSCLDCSIHLKQTRVTMTKMYLYTALLSMLLYPFGWYFVAGPYYVHWIYSDMLLSSYFTIGIAIAAVVSLFLARYVSQHQHMKQYGYVVVAIGGSVLSGIICVCEIRSLMKWFGENAQSHNVHWWFFMSMPGLVATYATYWLVNLFVYPVVPVAEKSTTTQKDH